MSKFQSKIIKDWELKGYFVLKLAKTNKNGIADLLCAKRGEKTYLIECKEKNDTIKPLQIYQNMAIAEHTGFGFIVIQDGKGIVDIDKLKNETTNLF